MLTVAQETTERLNLDKMGRVLTTPDRKISRLGYPGRHQSILYVTSEIADFVKAGGLGEVSAALPRALRELYDVRVLIPGYRQVLKSAGPVEVVGRLPGICGIPACDLGRVATKDGLTIYILLSPELYDRSGTPYGDENGVDWADND